MHASWTNGSVYSSITAITLFIFEKHPRYIALNLWLVHGNITGTYMCVMTFV